MGRVEQAPLWLMRPALGTFGAAVALGILVLSSAALADPRSSYDLVTHKAKAYDQDSGALVYTQTHRYLERDGKPVSADVVYTDASGQLYAKKALDFSESVYAPFFETRDVKHDYREAFLPVADDGKGKLVSVAGDGQTKCDETFARDPKMVIDAGFNSFLADHLQVIATGDTVKFDLYLAKACRGITFRARRKSQTDGQLVVGIEPASFVFRMVVPETVATYDAKTGQLLDYVGLSDLNDRDGRNLAVRIVFEPPVRRPVTEARAQELQARAGAL